ncbi:MAG: hypothetical protein WA364_14230 [Candidatus Nitrosopolaris sp.]
MKTIEDIMKKLQEINEHVKKEQNSLHRWDIPEMFILGKFYIGSVYSMNASFHTTPNFFG